MAKLTELDDAAALSLREQGWSLRAIGRHMGISDKTAQAACVRAMERRGREMEEPPGEPQEELTPEQSELILDQERYLAWIEQGKRLGYFTRYIVDNVEAF